MLGFDSSHIYTHNVKKKTGKPSSLRQVEEKIKATLKCRPDNENTTTLTNDDKQILAVALTDKETLLDGFFNKMVDSNEPCSYLTVRLILTTLQCVKGVGKISSMLWMFYGPLHVVVQVGSVMLEWNESSLISPYMSATEGVMELEIQPHSEWMKSTTRKYPKIQRATHESDFVEQVELTYIAVKEKILIASLIDLIIRFNRIYFHSPFMRNGCQFAHDALDVLHIPIHEEVSGDLDLRKYCNALGASRTPSIPFCETHSDLDEYVTILKQTKAIDGMKQHDLEFLLMLYFQFHLVSRTKLKDNWQALEAWQCGELQCCMEEVERRIQMESMKLHSFIRSIT